MEEKKIYARPNNSDYYEWDNYYNEDMAEEDNLWVGGNSSFNDINGKMRSDLVKLIHDLDYDIDATIDAYDIATEEDEFNKEIFRLARSYVKDYDSDISLNDQEINYLFSLIHDFQSCKSNEEDDILCDILELFYKEEFKCGTFHGNSQGDWMDYICPVSLSDKQLDYIEAVIMATGTEYEISGSKMTREEFDDGLDNYWDYTALWKDQDIKEWIADISNVSVDDVVLLDENGKEIK